jgi:hypothetical protein
MSLKDKLEKINNSPEIDIELQKFWQKLKKNWWLIQKLGEENYEPLFDIFHSIKDLEAGFNHFFKTNIPFSHSHDEHVLKQLEFMKNLIDSDRLTMITGHRHRKNAQAKDDLLSISL